MAAQAARVALHSGDLLTCLTLPCKLLLLQKPLTESEWKSLLKGASSDAGL